MLIGYARVSKLDQNPELQLDALKEAKCDKIYVDYLTGAKADRPQWQELLSYIREGDTLVVWKLDRAFRSMRQAVDIFNDFAKRGVHLKVLTMDIDTHTPMGKCMYYVASAFAEMERDILLERTQAGLLAARARGRQGGRPKALTGKKAAMVKELYENKHLSINEICETLNISRTTLYRYMNAVRRISGD
jgi:DNA invertase Pin-like site-specific DNA recombinase